MRQSMWIVIGLVLVLSLTGCNKSDQVSDSKGDTVAPGTDSLAEKAAVDPAEPDAATIAACETFAAPWGNGDWLEWAKANMEQAEAWLTKAPMRMPKADLTIIPKCTHMESMFVGFSKIEDLSVFAKLPKLKRLDLRFASNVKDLTPLKDAKNLEFLSIWGTQVSDLTPIVGLPNLTHIDAKMTPIKDIGMLPQMPKLQWIDLLKAPVADVTALAKVKDLKEIRLCSTQVTDLSAFYPQAEQYTYIDLCNTQFRDFAAFTKFPNIEYLQLWGLPLGDLSVLAHMTFLETLDLSNAIIASLKPLEKLPNLRKLILTGVRVDEKELEALKKAKPELVVVQGS